VKASRPVKTGIGKVEGWATPEDVMDAIKDGALVSVYVGPHRPSATIHRIRAGALSCLPNVPLGRVALRPECQRPTCGRCT
jgi:hypothetical protein